ncbi:kinase-like domain-containing protein [Thermothelomyces heterothallicus CBS 202.75]|uniref:kinase-like domain-containing protein n=1 Tax=Thermothelomyces heterothallicus CBS 202.75 TaxID=1149848 RepID=UPI003743B4CC
MTVSESGNMSEEKRPVVSSLQDLTIMEAFDRGATESKYVTFYLVTPEDELYFGQLFKKKKEITIEEYNSALEHVPDSEIYPEVPQGVALTIAPGDLDDASAFVKRPGIACYESVKGTEFVPKGLLEETLIMEQISKTPHPNIIRYLGCRIHRGRITSIVLERLDHTLMQYVHEPGFAQLDKTKFVDALESAVAYLHSLGLAHNDINPYNIMIKDGGQPVLIDFGSCQPFGGRLRSLGTPGWYEEIFYTSEAKHDTYALNKLRTWLENPQ